MLTSAQLHNAQNTIVLSMFIISAYLLFFLLSTTLKIVVASTFTRVLVMYKWIAAESELYTESEF